MFILYVYIAFGSCSRYLTGKPLNDISEKNIECNLKQLALNLSSKPDIFQRKFNFSQCEWI